MGVGVSRFSFFGNPKSIREIWAYLRGQTGTALILLRTFQSENRLEINSRPTDDQMAGNEKPETSREQCQAGLLLLSNRTEH
jgi:hypothetical protein